MKESSQPFQNRLSREKSPYLLQHAGNPVDWYSWGREAFEKALAENKLIFLSIGYSTCHWCHVMEEESFANPGVADILNRYYVSVKVDREERPDVDQVYMEAVMAMTGSGGWPLSVFLTPGLEPFFGGTYFPLDDRYGRPGFVSVLLNIAKHWEVEESKIRSVSHELASALREGTSAEREERISLGDAVISRAVSEQEQRFDALHGGFGTAPKFPSSHGLSFLLTAAAADKTSSSLSMVEKTLQAMAAGGLYDSLGGGFHRYSTDERWHVPHFEKMLYDQALLVRTYTEAFQLTKNPFYEKIARSTLDYVLRDLTHPEGGFFSAEDADSAEDAAFPKQKKEGAFYVWSFEEIKSLLEPAEARVFNLCMGVEEKGNVQHDPFGEFTGKNVLYEARTLEKAALELEISVPEAKRLLESSREKLFLARSLRLRPQRDDKILTDWNSLMAASFALAARAFEEPRYETAALRAVDFILARLKTKEGRLLHRWCGGDASVAGFLDDYVFMIQALLELYQTSFKVSHLAEARVLAEVMLKLFWDEKESGFFFTPHGGEVFFSRPKPGYDGALPSGNSMAVYTLSRLGRILQDSLLERRARETLESLSGLINSHPAGYPVALAGLDFLRGPTMEIIIVGDMEDPLVRDFMSEAGRRFSSRQIVIVKSLRGEAKSQIDSLIPGIRGMDSADGKPAVYVCRHFACQKPVTTLEEFCRVLDA